MTGDTREGIQQAFIFRSAEIQASVFEECPELDAIEVERVMNALASTLWRYRRPPDERFINWAKAWVRRQTRRHKLLLDMGNNYRNLLAAAISRSLHNSTGEDWSREIDDHIADMQLYLIENPRKIDTILNPKRAKVSSMLYGFAKLRMWAYRSKLADDRALTSHFLADLLALKGFVAPPPAPKDAYEKKSMRHELFGAH